MNESWLDKLDEMIAQGYVSVKKHSVEDLFIYNYTPKAQYERVWNEVTLNTRGLILDLNRNIISMPFQKFFNMEEHDPKDIPTLPFKSFNKLDGSLGISYWIKDVPYVSTRGSFESEQAIKGTQIIQSKYKSIWDKLNRDKTYLFEIIYPENRIVVDYGGVEDLFLLAIRDNKTGKYEEIDDSIFPIAKEIDELDFNAMKSLNNNNEEGFVVRFSNDFMMKIKFEEYIRLHRIVTNVSNKVIWEYLKDNKDFNELIKNVPDEFYKWVRAEEMKLRDGFNELSDWAKDTFDKRIRGTTRKEFALWAKEQKHPSLLFCLYTGKSIDKVIWKMIKPKYNKPFKQEI